MYLNGEAITEPDPRGGRIIDDRFLLLFNSHSDPLTFTIPEAGLALGWEVVIDTSSARPSRALGATGEVKVPGRSFMLLRATD